MTIQVLIVDDEPLARRGIRARLRAFDDFEVVAESETGDQALEAVEAHQPDLMFLDVQMPGLSGFDVLERIPSDRWPKVIFTTAFDQYALRAFDVHAVDYLLKPIDDDRFRRAVDRARHEVEQLRAGTLTQRISSLLADRRDKKPAAFLDRFVIRDAGKITFVCTDEIDWIEAAGDYISLHSGRKSYLLREPISSIESRLDPDHFVRIHRSTIVQFNRIKELHPFGARDMLVLLRDGTELKVSRGYRERLDERLK